MMLIHLFIASCLTVLPPGSKRQPHQQAHTPIRIEVQAVQHAAGIFRVMVSHPNTRRQFPVRIKNVIGREVWRGTVTAGSDQQLQIDLRHLPPGMYVLELCQGPCKQVYRFQHR